MLFDGGECFETLYYVVRTLSEMWRLDRWLSWGTLLHLRSSLLFYCVLLCNFLFFYVFFVRIFYVLQLITVVLIASAGRFPFAFDWLFLLHRVRRKQT